MDYVTNPNSPALTARTLSAVRLIVHPRHRSKVPRHSTRRGSAPVVLVLYLVVILRLA